MERIEYKNEKGKFHSPSDLPAIEWKNSKTNSWIVNGEVKIQFKWSGLNGIQCASRNCQTQPLSRKFAIVKNGIKMWYANGKPHRSGDLPAVEWGMGIKNGLPMENAIGITFRLLNV